MTKILQKKLLSKSRPGCLSSSSVLKISANLIPSTDIEMNRMKEYNLCITENEREIFLIILMVAVK